MSKELSNTLALIPGYLSSNKLARSETATGAGRLSDSQPVKEDAEAKKRIVNVGLAAMFGRNFRRIRVEVRSVVDDG